MELLPIATLFCVRNGLEVPPPLIKILAVLEVPKVATPRWLIENRFSSVEDETANGISPATPFTASFAYGDEVPTPRRLVTLSKKKFAESELNAPAPLLN